SSFLSNSSRRPICIGARPAAPNPMEMEEQQAPADAPPVEGGFDAAPPAQ
ncbi:hypothetical protein ACLBTQ_30580, partial [Pseudomonas aeruginosa]